MPVPPAPRSPVSTPVNARPRRSLTASSVSAFNAPGGTQDILPELMRICRWLEHGLLSTFAAAGYDQIDVPTYEPFALFGHRYGDQLRERLFTFYSDQEYALRPDFTASVGRLAAGGAFRDLPLPLRLSYSGQVFRYERIEPGVSREFRQVGIELLGAQGLAADLEVVGLAIEALERLELGAPEVRLHHVGVLPAMLETLIPDTEARRAIQVDVQNLLSAKQGANGAARIEAVLMGQWRESLGEDVTRRLLELLTFVGVPGEVRRTFEEKLGRSLPAELNHLLTAGEALEALGGSTVLLSPASSRGMGYYTGLWFEVRLPGLIPDREVASGGRYDPLVQEPGAVRLGGVGLAIQLDSLARAWKGVRGSPPGPARGLIAAASGDKLLQAAALGRRLRSVGLSAVVEPEPLERAAALRQASDRAARWLVWIGEEGTLEGVDLASGGASQEMESADHARNWIAGLG